MIMNSSRWCADVFREDHRRVLASVQNAADLDAARKAFYHYVTERQYEIHFDEPEHSCFEMAVARDCARVLRSVLAGSSDARVGFSVTQALWDLSRGIARPDLSRAFFAEFSHLLHGLNGTPEGIGLDASALGDISGREAALIRSRELDRIWEGIEAAMARYQSGLEPEAMKRRGQRRRRVQKALGATDQQWGDWRWQVRAIIEDPERLAAAVTLREHERAAVERAVGSGQPFGITPYYASLMDDDPESGRDRAVRAQVIPPVSYVDCMAVHGDRRAEAFDFMREADTSPVDLVTRRYPAIAILKPFNTCPQICVYCQRNWEIERAMAPGAMASRADLEKALGWIREHPAIKEVLVTGGDPLAMGDGPLERIMRGVADIPHVELIRIGTRTPVTLPMRITSALARMLGSFREPGVREVCLVTHVEHVSEVTPEFVAAVDRLRRRGLSVYNQLVFTFYVSRRFESAALRRLLRKCGVEPYYTFAPKAKEEMDEYRVPIARIMQEQQEEARLLPGMRRTDAPVYNVPGLGKNHLRAAQNRDVVSILPDGSRVYEFHPWEKNIVERDSYIGQDVPILTYLERLAAIGEDPAEYSSIWYYY
ncbi:lysine 2,3-aminomutase [Desulfomicrobium norvegicum]|uniref:Lysine 2,3-aminomutase n=2 Tax=Desulfomicrobium norvegicum (strain DSM 1741 / NCIMB 8310) TaxID=52561 RepID=A0A8G2C2R4_DESNO|nr:lysine 2,3-aminomutase [Desulfomicrobium norvegicum]